MCSSSPGPARSSDADSYTHLRNANEVVLGCAELSRIYANRLQFSQQYTYIYAFVIVLNASLLIWTAIELDYPLGHKVKFWVFVVADSLVTFFVLFEIVISLMAQGLHIFLSLWHNRIDMMVALLCIIALLGHVLGPTADLELEEDLESAVLLVRYTAQLARLAMLVKNYRRQSRKKELDVHLDCSCRALPVEMQRNLIVDIDGGSPRMHDEPSISPSEMQQHDHHPSSHMVDADVPTCAQALRGVPLPPQDGCAPAAQIGISSCQDHSNS
mmetsp:Transcript_54325/g.90139  ORF Transcript_54325/g.90139 Transcript_54325/m.90139 type:complete len:271 (-) Transcript_54325:41-853(-)